MSFHVRITTGMAALLGLVLTGTALSWRAHHAVNHAMAEVAEESAECKAWLDAQAQLAFIRGAAAQGRGADAAAGADALREAVRHRVSALSPEIAAGHRNEETDALTGLVADLATLADALRSGDGGDQVRRLEKIDGVVARARANDDRALAAALDAMAAECAAEWWTQFAVAAVFPLASLLVLLWMRHHLLSGLRALHARVRPDAGPGADLAELPGDMDRAMLELERLMRDLDLRVAEKSAALERATRLAGVGQVAADFAHEVNNPLNAIGGLAEAAAARLRAGDPAADPALAAELAEDLDVIARQTQRCRQIIGRLLVLVRDPGPLEPVPVAPLLAEAVRLAQAGAGERAAAPAAIDVRVEPPDLLLHAAPDALRQILLNLLINAEEAAGPGGRIGVEAAVHGGEVHLCVRDDGRGFSPEEAQQLFRPFHSTRRQRGGVGLGLSIAQALAVAMGGNLVASSPGPGRGAAFTLILPAHPKAGHGR